MPHNKNEHNKKLSPVINLDDWIAKIQKKEPVFYSIKERSRRSRIMREFFRSLRDVIDDFEVAVFNSNDIRGAS